MKYLSHFKINYSLFFLIIIVSSCASGSTIVTGKQKDAISPTEVQIYFEPPSKYETIGLVEATSTIEFSRQAAQDRVINELKSRAAKIGANGILLQEVGSRSGGTSGFHSGGVFFATTSEKMSAQALAIFVIEE
jgi:hypothetical protein